MIGIALLVAFEIAGVMAGRALFARQGKITQYWLGMVIGLMEMMIFPSLFAFGLSFTQWAQVLGLLFAVLNVLICGYWRKRHPLTTAIEPAEPSLDPPRTLLFVLLIPFVLLSAYLQYTHTLRNINGALYVGQSTYGDLAMHLSFATGLVDAPYPPEYTILPGTTLGYPFLVDAMSASMLLFDTPLSLAFTLPGTWMMGLIYLGVILFAWQLTHRRATVALAFVLVFLNGGLGFLRAWDQIGKDASEFVHIFDGYYQTPTNQPDFNLYWVNVICDMMIPQRTTLAGWTVLLPALYLLVNGIRSARYADFLILGVWAGAMPMIHTHSFLALGLISAGALCYSLLHPPLNRRQWMPFLSYGLIALILALPQLLAWTFPQTMEGGSLRFLFNWVNHGEEHLKDGYLWFWVKNVGLVYLCMVPAARSGDSVMKALSTGALFVYIVAELVVFQPNVYDNNKLFYAAFLVMIPIVARYLVTLYDHFAPIPGRRWYAALFLIVSLASGTLSIVRETLSEYQLFGAPHVQAAEWVRAHTDKDALFLTGTHHDNAIAALTGRKIVCGSSFYLYFHGLSGEYQIHERDAHLMMAFPQAYRALYQTYGVDYVFVSSYERQPFWIDAADLPADAPIQSRYTIDEAWFQALYPTVYQSDEWYESIRIYAISPRAIERAIADGSINPMASTVSIGAFEWMRSPYEPLVRPSPTPPIASNHEFEGAPSSREPSITPSPMPVSNR